MDILIVSETKVDDSFPTNQFLIDGYSKPYRLDHSRFSGGLLCYIRNDIPSKLLYSYNPPGVIQILCIEINLKNKKWLLFGGYNPHLQNAEYFFRTLSHYIEYYLMKYDNIIIIGDFNAEVTNSHVKSFLLNFALENLVKVPTCYKSITNPSCIDLIITNRKHCFQNTSAVEIGLSDFHKLVVTVLKAHYQKAKPKIITYRNYKNFNRDIFRQDLDLSLSKMSNTTFEYSHFENIFMNTLNNYAPSKQKYIRANESCFMNKTLKKAVMQRTKLKNKYLRNNTTENKLEYKKQRNFCVKLFKNEKKNYYENLDTNAIVDNKKFWQNVKPSFTDKTKNIQNITLVEGDVIISETQEVVNTFNDFFANAVKNLNIVENANNICNNNHIIDPVLKAVNKYILHPSIIQIRNNVDTSKHFNFTAVSSDEVLIEIKKLDSSKATSFKNIPIKVFKENADLYTNIITKLVNNSIQTCTFPDELKMADITPVFKKNEALNMENYRPVSLLPTVSKFFERIMLNQINTYIANHLSNYLCGFRKGFSPQHCLLIMIENMKKCIDEKGVAGAVLTDLSKAFDCLNYELLIAKLNAYGFNYDALRFILDYLSRRKQRVRIDTIVSKWSDIYLGVPQGSIVGPLLFNIFINDIFFFVKQTKITNYADDNTPYRCDYDITSTINCLENETNILMKWFTDNCMKANAEKCHLIVTKTDANITINLENEIITNTTEEKLLGVLIDNKLKFDKHVNNLCMKANQKLHALSRISEYMSTSKLRLVMKAFINSQFGYCPLVWMFHSREINNRINSIHERALRIVYKNKILTFDELLTKDKSVRIHHRNLQVLATEIYKWKTGIAPAIMNDIFKERHIKYSLRQFNGMEMNNVRTVNYGTETIRYRAPQIWSIVPENIKTSNTLTEFKKKIKSWIPSGCKCNLCRIYVQGLGFL